MEKNKIITLWNAMLNENNITTTENGAKAYKTSLNPIVDFMFKSATMRDSNEEEIVKLFLNAYKINPIYAIRLAFYTRDIRGGQGERRVFRICMKALSYVDSDSFNKIISFIPEYGRWDDLVYIYNDIQDANSKSIILTYLKAQLAKDIDDMKNSKSISLLAKWLPSENATAKLTIKLAKEIRRFFELTSKEYRQTLSALRKYLNVTEIQTSANDWYNIDYNIVPSKAMMKYKNAFNKHDWERYTEYINSLTQNNGTAKVNAATLYPFDIVKSIFKSKHTLLPYNEINLYDAQWKALPDFFGKRFDNALVVADVSSSMEGNPLNACIGLAIYIAERNKGLFNNKFITFSGNPELQEICGLNIYEKINNLSQAYWSMNTNIDAVFKLIFNTAITNKLSQKDLPSMIYIISDMQFDECCANGENLTIFEKWTKKFQQAKYNLPKICFWNVSNYGNNNIPITVTDTGVIVCSGYSPSLVKYIMESDMDNTMMLVENIVNSERYAKILK